MQDNQEKTSTEPCDQAAAFVRGALLLQEKWVLMIVYSLRSGPTGFSELMRRGNVNTTTLTQRLNLLEQTGILVKTIHSTMPPRTSYELTEAGHALEPTLAAITEWSGKYLPLLKPLEVCLGEFGASEKSPCQADNLCQNS
jgi:DNA-binding HxlR family transcriptional regulator